MDDDGFASLFEFLPIGAYRSTPAGGILRANPALVRLNGCDNEADLRALVRDIGHEWYVQPARREQFKKQLAEHGRVTGFESEVRRYKTGERIWVNENAHAVCGPDGRVAFYEGTVEEITERVRERERLVASETRLAQMIELVPGVVYRQLVRPDGTRRVAFVSSRVHELFGVTPEAVRAEPTLLYRVCHPDDHPRLRQAVEEAVAAAAPLTLEFRVVLDGRVRWVRLTSTAAPPEDGSVARVGIFFDITAQKESERALRDNGELWRTALESLGDAVWDWDLERDTGTVSPQGKALYGYRDDELSGDPRSMDALTHPDDVPRMRRARAAHFEGRAPVYVDEHRIRCKDGRWKWVLSRGVVMRRDAHGRPLRMIGTHTDIDAHKQAEALRRERDRASAADQAKTMLLSRVSHELRTPLNAILGFAQLLQLDAAATPEARQRYVGHVLQSGAHLLGLVDEILELSAVQAGRPRLQIEAIDARALAADVIGMFTFTAEQAGVAVRGLADDGAELPALAGDRRRCVQIVSNLVANAIKFNRRGGWVRLAAGKGADGTAAISVEDNGPGLTGEQLARLFQPFERAGAERGPVAGTGLGLALSRQLAEAMGGRIEVKSRPGEGSRFTLWLPVAERVTPASGPQP
ncbi:MAG: PAS domain-containing protein [Rubrivivax sp.]|nr:PAS domain-containing protein [Rubrivivax sp.]